MRAVARDPEARYARGRDFAADLRSFLRKQRGEPSVETPRRLSRAQAAIIGIVGAAVIGAGAYFLRSEIVPPPPKTGFVTISSEVGGADVFVDGKLVGPAPATFEATEGKHEVEIHKDGYYPSSFTIDVVADQQVQADAPPMMARTGR
ncbi:MAG: PEGA domain-containing protein, partial [Candidatus Binatia bacterium]